MGIKRLHGSSFLQNYLCMETFHKRYDNSIFVVNNCRCNSRCNSNGGFWNYFAGGVGMGLGMNLIGMLGNWLGGTGTGGWGCFGGGFGMGGFGMGGFGMGGLGFGTPMMNWMGGNTGVTGGGNSTVTKNYNNYVTEKNEDLKRIDKLEKKVKALEKRQEKGKKISQDDFIKLYNEVTKYTLCDSKDTDADNKRLADLKKALETLANGEQLTIPAAADKTEKAPAQTGEKQQAETPTQTQTAQSSDDILKDDEIDEFLVVYSTARTNYERAELDKLEEKFKKYAYSINDATKLNDLKEKVEDYGNLKQIIDIRLLAPTVQDTEPEIQAVTSSEPELSQWAKDLDELLDDLKTKGLCDKLNDGEHGAELDGFDAKFYPLLYEIADQTDTNKARKELERLLKNPAIPDVQKSAVQSEIGQLDWPPEIKKANRIEAIMKTEDEQEIVSDNNFSGLDLSEEEITTLKEYGSIRMDSGKKLFVADTKELDATVLKLLKNHPNITVAFAHNTSSHDQWLKGSVDEVTTDESDKLLSYIINCEGAGTYGLKFKVTPKEGSKYIVKYEPNSNSENRVLYTQTEGLEYEYKNGVLERTGNNPLVSTTKLDGYTALNDIDNPPQS